MDEKEPSASLLDDLLAFEEGELSLHETVALFQRLIDDGTVWLWPGTYGRTATDLIRAGLCMLPPVPQRDYYGNPIPSRHDVQPGTPGSAEYVEEQARKEDREL